MWFKNKDKRYNRDFDNYYNRITGNFVLSLFYVVVGLVAYGVYRLYYFLF